MKNINNKISTIVKENISSFMPSCDIDRMDMKILLECCARLYNMKNSLKSMPNKPEKYLKAEQDMQKLSVELTDCFKILAKKNVLKMQTGECALKIIHDAWSNQYYYTKKVPYMDNEIQLNLFKPFLPERKSRLVNINKSAFNLWNRRGKQVPFYYIGTYAPFRNVLTKFLKNIMK